MTMYKTSDFAIGVLGDIKTEEEIINERDGMHPTMRDEGYRLLCARDQAARLMFGAEEFGALWRNPLEALYEPQQIDIHADRLVSACGHITSMAPYPADVVGELLATIAGIDVAHPLVANWTLLRDACTGMDQAAPGWPALAAALAVPE